VVCVPQLDKTQTQLTLNTMFHVFPDCMQTRHWRGRSDRMSTRPPHSRATTATSLSALCRQGGAAIRTGLPRIPPYASLTNQTSKATISSDDFTVTRVRRTFKNWGYRATVPTRRTDGPGAI